MYVLYADLAVNQCVSSPASGSSLTSLEELQLSAVSAVKIYSRQAISKRVSKGLADVVVRVGEKECSEGLRNATMLLTVRKAAYQFGNRSGFREDAPVNVLVMRSLNSNAGRRFCLCRSPSR